MYIDIDANENVAEATVRTFKEVAAGVQVRSIRLEIDGRWQWCAVVGWSESGPLPALFTPIEESGDGPARLLHGGEQGLRFARLTDPDAAGSVKWDLADSRQWGEAFVLCTPETMVR